MRTLCWSALSQCDEAFHLAFTSFRRGQRAPDHTHDFPEVFWIVSGRGVHHINGATTTLTPGDLTPLRPTDRHGIRPLGSHGISFINLAFAHSTLHFLLKRYFPHQPHLWGGQERIPCCHRLSLTQQQQLNASARRLGEAARTQLEIDRFLINLLTAVLAQGLDDPYAACPAWLRRACEQIRSPQHFRRGTRALATLAERTPEHVARVLKQTTGKTPSTVVNEARLDYAAAQLTTTGREILDIALDCGFRSLGHFYHIFSTRYSCPPRQYRLRNQAAVPR